MYRKFILFEKLRSLFPSNVLMQVTVKCSKTVVLRIMYKLNAYALKMASTLIS